MNKKISILIIAFLVLVFAMVMAFVLWPGNNQRVAGDSSVLDSQTTELQSVSSDGVDVSIEKVIRQAGKTIIELSLSNHRYDLSKMDAMDGSSLLGSSPIEYNIVSSAMGGHHVKATLVFEDELSGSLVVDLGESLIFKFNI